MVIRAEQFEALRKNRKDNFTRHVTAFVRSHLPSETQPYSDKQLLEEVDDQIENGRGAGLKSESDLASFVSFRFMAGSDFRSQGRFAPIWSRSDIDAHVKVAWTRELLSGAGLTNG